MLGCAHNESATPMRSVSGRINRVGLAGGPNRT
jgi:hypothetical protein